MNEHQHEAPWWLEPGSEQCPSCEGHYRYEAGYFCLRCDAPVCPVCVRYLRVSGDMICPRCDDAVERG